MEKLKDPKVIGAVVAVVLSVLIAMFANIKPAVQAVCEQVCPTVDLKE